MRIAIFIPGFQKDEADWCIPAFTNLARELAKHAEVEVFALRHPRVCSAYWVGSVRVHTIGAGSFGTMRVPGISLAKLWVDLLRHFDRVHQKRGFDVIVGFWATESGALACVAGKRCGVPVLVHVAGGELVWLDNIGYGNWQRGLAGALVEVSLQNADAVSVPSDYIRNLLTRRHPAASARTTLWPLGVDIALFSASNSGEDHYPVPFTFIAVASLLPVKGLDLLVEAAAELHAAYPNYEFQVLIVGDGPGKHRLAEKIIALELGGYVVLGGAVGHAELPATLASANCFVMTSWHEAQCMSLLEAAATGLPWIATPVGAAVDMAQSAKPSGILIEEGRPGSLAAAMRDMMELSCQDRMSMGRAARERVLAAYDLQKQSARLLALLQALTAPHPRRRMKPDSQRSVTLDVLRLLRNLAAFSLSNLRR